MAEETFKFLLLPSEIRNIIYELVLPMDSQTEISAIKLRKLQVKQLRGNKSDSEQISRLPILYVNRQIHLEGSHILYHNARFLFNVGSGVNKFLNIIGPENASFVRHMVIRTDLFAIENFGLAECLTQTLRVPKLPNRLTIETQQGIFGDQKIPGASWYKSNRHTTYIELLCSICVAVSRARIEEGWRLFDKSGTDGLDLDESTVLKLTLVAGKSKPSDGVEVDLKAAIEKVLEVHREDVMKHLGKVGRDRFVFAEFDRLGIEYDH